LRKLRLAGGGFMNVKINKALGELAEVDDPVVAPSCGDETNAIGAPWALLADRGLAGTIEPFGPLYLGPEPTTADYEKSADRAHACGCTVVKSQDVEDDIADLLARGEIVGRVAGREEFGARALGNRSLLADPSRTGIAKTL